MSLARANRETVLSRRAFLQRAFPAKCSRLPGQEKARLKLGMLEVSLSSSDARGLCRPRRRQGQQRTNIDLSTG